MSNYYRLYFIILLFSFFFLQNVTYGQANDNKIGLATLVDRAKAGSPFLVSDSAAVLIKLAQQNATNYNGLPSLKFNVQADIGTNNNMPGGYFSYGIVPGNSRVRNTGNSSTILSDLAIAAFDWTVYDFGGRKAAQAVAASDVAVEQSRFQQTKYNLTATIIENYLQWLQVEDLLSIQQLNILRNTEIRQSVLALTKSGIKAGVDTSIAGAEISKSRLVYVELEGQRRLYKLLLATLANVSENNLTADTSLINRIIDLQGENDGLDSISKHPLLEYYQSLYNNSLEKELLVKKSYFPAISLQAAVWGRGSSVTADDKFRELSSGFGIERGNYLVGVGLTYDLFSIKKKQLQLKTQQAVSSFAQKQFDEQKQTLTLTERQLEEQLITAKERLREIPNQLAAAQAAYRQKLALYKNGLTDILQLNEALRLLYRAEIDMTTARYAYCKTLFEKAINSNTLQSLLQLTN